MLTLYIVGIYFSIHYWAPRHLTGHSHVPNITPGDPDPEKKDFSISAPWALTSPTDWNEKWWWVFRKDQANLQNVAFQAPKVSSQNTMWQQMISIWNVFCRSNGIKFRSSYGLQCLNIYQKVNMISKILDYLEKCRHSY